MTVKIQCINHVGLVVRDRAKSEQFFMDVLGLNRHHKISSWFVLNGTSTLHLIEIPEAGEASGVHHEIQHFALQVQNLEETFRLLLAHDLRPFQMNFEGTEHALTDPDDPLDFGLGSVFVTDPDGNLVEFLEEGRGIFQVDMRPIVA